jgi:hypothetical protein
MLNVTEHQPPALCSTPHFSCWPLLVTDALLPCDKSHSGDWLSRQLWSLGPVKPIKLGLHVFISSVPRAGAWLASKQGERARHCQQHILPQAGPGEGNLGSLSIHPQPGYAPSSTGANRSPVLQSYLGHFSSSSTLKHVLPLQEKLHESPSGTSICLYLLFSPWVFI